MTTIGARRTGITRLNLGLHRQNHQRGTVVSNVSTKMVILNRSGTGIIRKGRRLTTTLFRQSALSNRLTIHGQLNTLRSLLSHTVRTDFLSQLRRVVSNVRIRYLSHVIAVHDRGRSHQQVFRLVRHLNGLRTQNAKRQSVRGRSVRTAFRGRLSNKTSTQHLHSHTSLTHLLRRRTGLQTDQHLVVRGRHARRESGAFHRLAAPNVHHVALDP